MTLRNNLLPDDDDNDAGVGAQLNANRVNSRKVQSGTGGSTIKHLNDEPVQPEKAEMSAEELARAVRDGKLLPNGKEFSMKYYTLLASIITPAVLMDVFYTIFLSYESIDNIEAILGKSLNVEQQAATLGVSSAFLMANLICDLTAVVVANEASGLVTGKSYLEEAFEKHGLQSERYKRLALAIYVVCCLAALPSYIGLSTPDGVSMGNFTKKKNAIYGSCAVFGVAGPLYYFMFLNKKRADHIVGLLAQLEKRGVLGFTWDTISQPLMLSEALVENGCAVGVRVLLAGWGSVDFGNETLGLDINDPALVYSLIIICGSTFLDAMTTRTKDTFVKYLQYKDVGFKDLYREGLLKSLREGYGFINAEKLEQLKELKDSSPNTEKGEKAKKAMEKFLIKKNNRRIDIAMDLFTSVGAGVGTCFIAPEWEYKYLVGSSLMLLGFYTKSMANMCEAYRINNPLEEKSPNKKDLILAQEAFQEKEKLFKELLDQYRENPSFQNKRKIYNVMARLLRYSQFYLAISTVDTSLDQWGVNNELGLSLLNHMQIWGAFILIGLNVYLNEARVYAEPLIDGHAEIIARASMLANEPSYQSLSYLMKAWEQVCRYFKPMPKFTNDELKNEVDRVKAKFDAEHKAAAHQTNRWFSCFRRSKPNAVSENKQDETPSVVIGIDESKNNAPNATTEVNSKSNIGYGTDNESSDFWSKPVKFKPSIEVKVTIGDKTPLIGNPNKKGCGIM